MNRRQRVAMFDPVYTTRGSRGDPCTYCGQVSDTLDHIPSLRVVEMAHSCDQECEGPFIKVPACNECNGHLGPVRVTAIAERRHIVREGLRKKYRKFLNIPNWDEDELKELSPDFAREVRASVNFANHVRARLAWGRAQRPAGSIAVDPDHEKRLRLAQLKNARNGGCDDAPVSAGNGEGLSVTTTEDDS